ncbi:MAG: hypothetical protein KAT62_14755 [Desulfuromonadales bacterium]|nr:hypothetical protein [Desulfuromonadales bacterium]
MSKGDNQVLFKLTNKYDIWGLPDETGKITDASLLELVDKFRKAFERYQEQLIGLFLPESAGVEYRREVPKT